MMHQILARRLFSMQKNFKLPKADAEFIINKKFTQEELDKFSELTGDFNVLHTKCIPIEERKVHGAFLNAIIAGIIGTQFPGPGTVVLQQTLSFPKACRINVDTEILLRLNKPRKICTVTFECKQNNDVVFQGDAKLLLNSLKSIN